MRPAHKISLLVTSALVLASFALTPALAQGQLRGTIVDQDGNPVKDVEVKMIPENTSLTVLTVKSNKKGKFVFGLVRPTNYRLVAFPEGMRIYHISANRAEPDDDSAWDYEGEVPAGAELPMFTMTGVSSAQYDLKVKPSEEGPGEYGTGMPVSTTTVIIEMIQAGEVDEAVAELERNIEEKPDNATLYYLMGFAQLAGNHPDEAQAAAAKTLELDPGFEGANLLMGKAIESKGDFEGAVEYFEAEADTAIDETVVRDSLLALAVAHEQLGQEAEAMAALERVAELGSDQAGIYRELADLYLRNGEIDKAREMLAKLEELGAADPMILYNIGAERFNANDFQTAAELFEEAVEIDPTFAEGFLRLGYARLNLGDTAGATEALKAYLELSPEETDATQTARGIVQQLEAAQQ